MEAGASDNEENRCIARRTPDLVEFMICAVGLGWESMVNMVRYLVCSIVSWSLL